MIDSFEMVVGSDTDYEDLIAEVSCQGEFLMLVSQEEGPDTPDIEIHPRRDGEPWHLKLDDLEEVIQCVRRRLWELRRTSE